MTPGDEAIAELEHWLKCGEPGETRVYHVGLLMADRQEDDALDAVALRLLWECGWSKRVLLVQKRVGEGVCEYRAIKRASSSVPGRLNA